MEKIRSFIAIKLPTALQDELAQLQQRWNTPRQSFVKWVNPSSIHLTLKFLGDIDSLQVPPLKKALAEVTDTIKSFQLVANSCGVFPNIKRARVVWVGVGGDFAILSELQQAIDKKLASLGFPLEKQSFKPHLTLGRLRHGATTRQVQYLGELVSSTEFTDTGKVKVNTINLMKSTLTNNGAIYSQLASLPLSGKGC